MQTIGIYIIKNEVFISRFRVKSPSILDYVYAIDMAMHDCIF